MSAYNICIDCFNNAYDIWLRAIQLFFLKNVALFHLFSIPYPNVIQSWENLPHWQVANIGYFLINFGKIFGNNIKKKYMITKQCLFLFLFLGYKVQVLSLSDFNLSVVVTSFLFSPNFLLPKKEYFAALCSISKHP